MDPVRIVVFGVTGRTGRLLVEGALQRGHDVTALVGARDDAGALPSTARIVRGQVLDGGAVSDAVDGQEAALVALADGSRTERRASAQGVLNVIRSMQRYRVPRLVVLSASLAHPGPDPSLPWFREHLVKPLLHRHLAATLRRAEVTIRQSELEWTLVRATSLTDKPPRGSFHVGPGYSLRGGTAMARVDVAAFMLDEIGRRHNVGHAIALAY